MVDEISPSGLVWLAVQGVKNQHRLSNPIALGSPTNEFEIKRNKAHGGCLGIERR